jgi:hypothetical protein
LTISEFWLLPSSAKFFFFIEYGFVMAETITDQTAMPPWLPALFLFAQKAYLCNV